MLAYIPKNPKNLSLFLQHTFLFSGFSFASWMISQVFHLAWRGAPNCSLGGCQDKGGWNVGILSRQRSKYFDYFWDRKEIPQSFTTNIFWRGVRNKFCRVELLDMLKYKFIWLEKLNFVLYEFWWIVVRDTFDYPKIKKNWCWNWSALAIIFSPLIWFT